MVLDKEYIINISQPDPSVSVSTLPINLVQIAVPDSCCFIIELNSK